MNRRYKLLFGHPLSKVAADAWMQLKYIYTPNIPSNILEETQIAQNVEGIVSKQTQLSALSIVDDVKSELDRIEEEEKAQEETAVDRQMFGNIAQAEEELQTEDLTDEQ